LVYTIQGKLFLKKRNTGKVGNSLKKKKSLNLNWLILPLLPLPLNRKKVMKLLFLLIKFKRWVEHYKELASDVSGHRLNWQYWSRVLRSTNLNQITWSINDHITTNEIKNVISKIKNNIKLQALMVFLLNFIKLFFNTLKLEERYPAPGICLEIIFNIIWNGSFPRN